MHERHGHTSKNQRSRLYSIWRAMLARCYYQKHQSFAYYGERGITVCDAWRKSFQAFADWALDSGYRPDRSIDRVDCNGNYEPANCRWATDLQQANNKRPGKNELIAEHAGRRLNLLDWSRSTGISYTTLVRRFHSGKRGATLFAEPTKLRYRKALAVQQTKNGKAKLTDEEVAEIASSDLSGHLLARRFRVAQSTISMIRRGHRRGGASVQKSAPCPRASGQPAGARNASP